jgi:hypothetical protein
VNNIAADAPLDILATKAAPIMRAGDNGLRPPARYGQNDRAIALGRRAWLFAGSDRGGEHAAAIESGK